MPSITHSCVRISPLPPSKPTPTEIPSIVPSIRITIVVVIIIVFIVVAVRVCSTKQEAGFVRWDFHKLGIIISILTSDRF